MRFLPTENEVKLLRQYEKERKPLEELSDEDRFMLHFSKVERLTQRMAIMAFLGNFSENIQMLMPVTVSIGLTILMFSSALEKEAGDSGNSSSCIFKCFYFLLCLVI